MAGAVRSQPHRLVEADLQLQCHRMTERDLPQQCVRKLCLAFTEQLRSLAQSNGQSNDRVPDEGRVAAIAADAAAAESCAGGGSFIGDHKALRIKLLVSRGAE